MVRKSLSSVAMYVRSHWLSFLTLTCAFGGAYALGSGFFDRVLYTVSGTQSISSRLTGLSFNLYCVVGMS
jgi:hypothetical protein